MENNAEIIIGSVLCIYRIHYSLIDNLLYRSVKNIDAAV